MTREIKRVVNVQPSIGEPFSGLVRPAEVIARRFHEEYEHLAPVYGWSTQEASQVRWEDLPNNQRRLMIHTVANLLAEGVIGGGSMSHD